MRILVNSIVLVPHKLNRLRLRPTYLSGETFGNVFPFSGLACIRSDAARTNWPTVDANPAMKELKGKFVIKAQ